MSEILNIDEHRKKQKDMEQQQSIFFKFFMYRSLYIVFNRKKYVTSIKFIFGTETYVAGVLINLITQIAPKSPL